MSQPQMKESNPANIGGGKVPVQVNLLRNTAQRVLNLKDAELTPMNPVWWMAFSKLVVKRFQNQQLLQVASSLTFTTVLSLVPLITVALAIFTAFPMFEKMQVSLQTYLFESFFPETLSDTILTYINQFSAKAKGLTAIGTAFLVVTALTTMLTVDRVFNQIWNVRRPRTLINKVLIYWAVLSLAPVFIAISLSTSTALIAKGLKGIGDVAGFFAALSWVIPLMVSILAFAFIYRTVPNRFVNWKDAVAGGAVSALLFEITKRAFAAYISHFPSYTAVYGALAAFPIFLLWIYLSWIVVLLGASVVAALPVARAGYWDSSHKPGQRWMRGLSVLVELDRCRKDGLPGRTMEELRLLVHVPPDQLDDILGSLIDANLVGLITGPKGTDRYAMICDPSSVSAVRVAKVLWFDPDLLGEWDEKLPDVANKMRLFSDQFLEKPFLQEWLIVNGNKN